ncbi:hypothetical protein CesoFtcFv8_016559 [Champsocephalus esox]|uniref:Uncharacterized protein n=1 Tax=Champsocephalus esox TaxID=159716 RepID=A0AAN8BMY0_9TELE|nr:hypothetical protein CesoFtcFv8_016559 [Champsocephalus esox]
MEQDTLPAKLMSRRGRAVPERHAACRARPDHEEPASPFFSQPEPARPLQTPLPAAPLGLPPKPSARPLFLKRCCVPKRQSRLSFKKPPRPPHRSLSWERQHAGVWRQPPLPC